MSSGQSYTRDHSHPSGPGYSDPPSGAPLGQPQRGTVDNRSDRRDQPSNNHRVTSPQWTDPGTPSNQPTSQQQGDDPAVLRRREANRLAAQRFRTKKKTHQEGLEERIRQLEEENAMLRDELHHYRSPHHPRHSPSLHRPRLSGEYPYPPPHFRRTSPPVSSPVGSEAEARMMSLEAANRRLQDDVKAKIEEIDQLRATLAQWRDWERSLSHPRDLPPSSDPHPVAGPVPAPSRQPSLTRLPIHGRLSPPPPLLSPTRSPPTYSPYPYAPSPMQQARPPVPDRRHSSNSSRRRSFSPPRGSGIQLPPIRVPSPGLSAQSSSLSGPPSSHSHTFEKRPPPHSSSPYPRTSPYSERPPPPWPPLPQYPPPLHAHPYHDSPSSLARRHSHHNPGPDRH